MVPPCPPRGPPSSPTATPGPCHGRRGTALGVARSARQSGRLARGIAGETHPNLQGARLATWEREQQGIPYVLITDSMAAMVHSEGGIDAIVVGADRVAANGDIANKIGTLGLAVLPRHHRAPLCVVAPTSTIDQRTPDGTRIPIEQRDGEEARGLRGLRWAAEVDVHNPAFDVPPPS